MVWAVLIGVIPIHFDFPRLNFFVRDYNNYDNRTNHSDEYHLWTVSEEFCQVKTLFRVEPYQFLIFAQILKRFRELDLHFQRVEDQI